MEEASTNELDVESAVKIYIGSLLCRILAFPRHATLFAPASESGVEVATAETERSSEEEESFSDSERSSCDSLYCNLGADGLLEDEEVVDQLEPSFEASATKPFQDRFASSVWGSMSYVGGKMDVFDGVAGSFIHNVEENVKTRATTFKAKAADTIEWGRVNAEEKGIRHARQLEDIVNRKSAFIEEKTRSTYAVLEPSVTRCSQQVKGLVNQQVATMAPMVDKTKAAAKLVGSKSGEIACRARTKTEEFATGARVKLQEASAPMADKTKAAAKLVGTKSGEIVGIARTKSEEFASGARVKLQEAGAPVADKTKAAAKLVGTKSGEIVGIARTKSEEFASGARVKLQEAGAPMADKTKAAAKLVGSKSGEIAGTARTKSEELATGAKGKLQTAGQDGLKTLAKSLRYGGA